METYTARRDEIWSDLRSTLAEAYLTGVNSRLRDELIKIVPSDVEPVQYHRQIRDLAGLIAQPDIVVQQFAAAPWRTIPADDPPVAPRAR